MSTTEYYELPQPEEVSLREKEDAMGSYLMMFAAFAVGVPIPAVNLIAAIVYYFINRNKGKFVKFHTIQSLYSQIPTTLMNWVLTAWIIRNFFWNDGNGFDDIFWGYVATVVIFNLVYVIYSIVAAIKARKGHFFYFIFFGRIAYHFAYRITEENQIIYKNQPPS